MADLWKSCRRESNVHFSAHRTSLRRYGTIILIWKRIIKVILEEINPNDSYLLAAAEWGSGIRILRQDLWEMIASFLISQQNHITRIRKCIQNLCETYGEERTGDSGNTFYTFPEPEKLAELGDDDLKACNLGYRSKYVVRTAKSIVSGEVDLDAIQHLPYAKQRKSC